MSLSRQQVEAWQKQIDYGNECTTCGLTEWGVDRARRYGYAPKPCLKCPDSIRKLFGDD